MALVRAMPPAAFRGDGPAVPGLRKGGGVTTLYASLFLRLFCILLKESTMTKRDIVQLVLKGGIPPYTPWSFRFTHEAEEKLVRRYETREISRVVDNHFVELGNDVGFFDEIGDNLFRDHFGVVWDRSIDKDIGNVKGEVLPGPALRGFSFPDPHDRRFFEDIPDKLKAYPDCFRLYCIGFSLFERAWTLRGMTNLYMDFVDNPRFVHELFEAIAEYNIEQVKKALTYDIDAVYFGDDWGQQHGLLMGYDLWKEFIYPVLERMYAVVHEAGKYVVIHSCGDVTGLLDDLVALGVNCFNPFQPEVMDVQKVHAQYRGGLSFWGGLSLQQTLPYGTVQDVRNETAMLIEMGRKGGFILSPSHAVEGDVPLENMCAFIEEVQKQETDRAV